MSIHLSDPDFEPDFDDPDGPFGTGPAIDDPDPLYDPEYDLLLFDDGPVADPFGARRSHPEYSVEEDGWPYSD